jgi:hypothetical protein
MIKCPACGSENADGANFCISCGFDINATATENRVRTDSVSAPTASTPPFSSPSVDMPREYLDSSLPPTPPAPPPPPASSFGALPNYAPPPVMMQNQPAKQRSSAIILEALLGLFSLPGIGWMYAGNTTVGVVLLVVFLVAQCIMFSLDFVTATLFTCIHVPVWLLTAVISSVMLYNYTKQHPETFGP